MNFRMNFLAYFPIHVVLGLVLLASSCTVLPGLGKRFTFEPLDQLDAVDQVRIFLNDPPNSKYIKIIDDAKEVDLIVKTFKNYSHDWMNYISPQGAPLSITFFHKGEVQCVVTIAYTDQTTSKDTIYYFGQPLGSPGRPLTKQEFQELMQVLGVEEGWAYRGNHQ